jgi:hypothetical protein
VKGPGLFWTNWRIEIPELRLVEKAAGIVEAAGVRDGRRIVTTQLSIRTRRGGQTETFGR